MQTFLDTVHTAFVFFCNNSNLSQSSFWQKVIDIIQPLTNNTNQLSEVIPHIYHTQKDEWGEYTNIQWNKAELEKWTYTDTTHLQFERVMVSFPSIKKCYEEKYTPDIFLLISRKATEKEKRYEFVFMLIIKNEFQNSFENNRLASVLEELKSFLTVVFSVKKERTWAIKESEFQYGDSFQYFFPSAILANGDEFILRKGYEDWEIH